MGVSKGACMERILHYMAGEWAGVAFVLHLRCIPATAPCTTWQSLPHSSKR